MKFVYIWEFLETTQKNLVSHQNARVYFLRNENPKSIGWVKQLIKGTIACEASILWWVKFEHLPMSHSEHQKQSSHVIENSFCFPSALLPHDQETRKASNDLSLWKLMLCFLYLMNIKAGQSLNIILGISWLTCLCFKESVFVFLHVCWAFSWDFQSQKVCCLLLINKRNDSLSLKRVNLILRCK